jgi:dolichol-phosphate mannosyltransferase
VRELPYRFRERQRGESKLDTLVAWEYGMPLADKLFGRPIPARFALFGLIGGLELLVHLATLWIALHGLGFEFAVSRAAATVRGNDFQLLSVQSVYLSGPAAPRACFGARPRRFFI